MWLLDRAGGEAQKLTDVKGGVSEYAWSPDGKRLVLAVDDPDPNDAPEKEKKDGKPATKPPVVIDRYHFKQDRLGYLGALRTHLYLFDVERRATEPLTSGVWDEASPEWSPDGQSDRVREPPRPGSGSVDQQRHLGRRGEGRGRSRARSRPPPTLTADARRGARTAR